METLSSGYTLIEGPTWSAVHGLVFSDVHEGGVYALRQGEPARLIVPHRRGIGGLAIYADPDDGSEAGLVVGGRNVAYKGALREHTAVLLGNDTVADIIGFNDLTTDSAGRIYVGSLGASPFEGADGEASGYLHMIDLDGSSHVLSDGVRLTNGLGFSPDGRVLYHSDSRSYIVRAYGVRDDGTVDAYQPFARIEGGGIPDGLAVAVDGSVWVAIADGKAVHVFESDGSLRTRIECPLPMVTSVCFGGEDLRDLYIVTGSRGAPDDHSGTVYRMPVDVPGLPVAPARVPLP